MLAKGFVLITFLLSLTASVIFSTHENQMPMAVMINSASFESKMSSLEKTLIQFDADYEIYMTFKDEFPEPGTFSALIIGGGTSMYKFFDDAGNKLKGSELIENTEVPVLGICMGSQIIERIYGGSLSFFEQRGWSEMTIVKEDPLLEGLDDNFDAWSNHGFGLAFLPEGFELLCKGEENSIQIIKHMEKPTYGILFHPEANTVKENPAKKIIENFISFVKAYAKSNESTNLFASKH